MANTKTQAKADSGRNEEFLAVLQESNDLATTATMNAVRANKMAEGACSKAAAEVINVAQGAKALALIGALFGAAATVVALLAVYGTLIGN
jgi:hypothetical protein